jgi:hypothetical protein
MHKSRWFVLVGIIALLIACSPEEVEVTREVLVTQDIPVTVEVTREVTVEVPQELEVTREVTVEVPQEVEGTVQVAVDLTVAAWPSPTPIPSPTSTPEPTQPAPRWKDKVDDPLRKMVKVTDLVRDVSWYYHENVPEEPTANWIGLNIEEREGEYELFLFIYYTANDWLLIEEYLVGADDQVFTIETEDQDFERDLSDEKIIESFQTLLSQSQLQMIEAVIESESAVLRYIGAEYYSEREIATEEKDALRVTLAAFEELGGDLYSLPDSD